MPAVLGNAPSRDQDVAALDLRSPAAVRTIRLTFSPDRPLHLEKLGGDVNLNAFVDENPLHLLRDVADPPGS